MDNLNSVSNETIKYETKEEYEVFGEQADCSATLDLQTGTINLSIVSDGAKNGIKVTLEQAAADTILQAVYTSDLESILALNMYTIIRKIECIDTGETVFLTKAIFRAVQLVISKIQLQVTEDCRHISEDVRKTLRENISNNMY